MANKIFIGTSIDGYIADREGGLDFLDTVPNPDKVDLGYTLFMKSVDALIMGRKTLETVISFNVPWPYSKPVFVFSSTMKKIPKNLKGKVEIVSGTLKDVVKELNTRDLNNFYIDGGKLIQSFLVEDMIDEMIITQIPVLIGGGIALFGSLPKHLQFELVKSKVFLKSIVQSHYKRLH